ncbi:MAG: hypothetical protein HY770_02835 [Chitinivibrionia bacterium]|nr:hypothetical protein [Chitinivibrionia bacterium]
MDPDKFEDVLEDIRRVVEEKGFILNHEIESLIGEDFSPEGIVSLYDRLSEEKIEYFDSPEKAKMRIDAKRRREEKEEVKTEDAIKAVIRYDDPVRMYLREMGKVPLLDRQGEVEIAKRIEEGQLTIAKAVFSLDTPINELQLLMEKVEKGELRLEEVVQVETGGLHPHYTGKKERQARFRPIKRIAQLRREIIELEKKSKLKVSTAKKSTLERSMENRRDKLFEEYLKLQLNPNQLERIVDMIRGTRDRIRDLRMQIGEYENFVGMSQAELARNARGFPQEDENAEERNKQDRERGEHRQLAPRQGGRRYPARGAAGAKSQERDDRGERETRDRHRQALHQPRARVPGFDTGRKQRFDARRRQVRLPQRVQVQHVRDVVDQASHHARHR